MIEKELQKCQSQAEIHRYLDKHNMSYSISRNPYDLIEDYAASDAFSIDDMEGLLAMEENDLIEHFKLCPFAQYVYVAGCHIFVFEN